MIMSSAKEHFQSNGKDTYTKILKTISPVSWEHISLNGFYDVAENDENWDINEEIEKLELSA
jgi:hypothetical protein